MAAQTTRWHWILATGLVCAPGCKKDDPPQEDPPPEEQPELAKGDVCDPDAPQIPPEELAEYDTDGEEVPAVCAPGLACEAVADSNGDYVCGTALEIRGRIVDSTTGDPIEGALVAALNESGEPVTNVVASDACGDYVLPMSVRRTADGEFAETPKWTLSISAQDYLPFPSGSRPALPVDIADAVADPDPPPPQEDQAADTGGETGGEEEVYVTDVIDNAATSVALIGLPEGEQGGATISGTVGGEAAAGTLVVAEGAAGRVPYGIADASGFYTLFNVADGAVTVRGYRRDLAVETNTVTASGDELVDVDLALVAETRAELGTIDGSLNIVNAPGGAVTSVVLVPASVYNAELERGPVPIGLRVPDPPMVPNVTSDFAFTGVPDGTYKVLVAFENDELVRDPDEGISGTAIQEITLGLGETATLDASFKVTEALAIVSPGRDGPEVVDERPTFVFADDSSEDGYILLVFNALGDRVWETELEGVSGSDDVEVPYGGPALTAGMYYQFRVTSFREPPNGDRTFISRTEDLRGVFVYGEANAQADCTLPDEGGTGDSGGSGESG